MSELTTSIHRFVYDTVEPTIRAYSKIPEGQILTEETVYRTLFENFRYIKGVPYGLRLTHGGNAIMAKHFEKYQYENSSRVNHKSLIVLDQNMQWPYYVGHKYVAFYSQTDAGWYAMTGYDLNQYTKLI